MADPLHPRPSAVPLTASLCATAGAVDAVAYLVFGKIFIANMTGNTVLFAISIATRDWQEAALRIGVVLAYQLGVLVPHFILRKITLGSERTTRMIVLGIEFVLLAALASAPHPQSVSVPLLVLLAIALGAQNDAFHRIGGIRLNTSFITGDLEELGDAIASSRNPGKRQESRRKMAMFLSAWSAYAVGGLLAAFAALDFAEKALWFPAGLIVAAVVLTLAQPSTSGPEPPETLEKGRC